MKKQPPTRKELLDDLLPGLNALFGSEYHKYGKEELKGIFAPWWMQVWYKITDKFK